MSTVDFDPSHPHAICGTSALGGRLNDGCREPVFFDRPFPDDQHVAIRCADCMAVYCPLCARKHFDNSKRNFIELAMRYEGLKAAAAPFATCDGSCATCVQAGEPCASNRLWRQLHRSQDPK